MTLCKDVTVHKHFLLMLGYQHTTLPPPLSALPLELHIWVLECKIDPSILLLQSHTSAAASVIAEALEAARKSVASKAVRAKEAEATKSIDTGKLKPKGEPLSCTCWANRLGYGILGSVFRL